MDASRLCSESDASVPLSPPPRRGRECLTSSFSGLSRTSVSFVCSGLSNASDASVVSGSSSASDLFASGGTGAVVKAVVPPVSLASSLSGAHASCDSGAAVEEQPR